MLDMVFTFSDVRFAHWINAPERRDFGAFCKRPVAGIDRRSCRLTDHDAERVEKL